MWNVNMYSLKWVCSWVSALRDGTRSRWISYDPLKLLHTTSGVLGVAWILLIIYTTIALAKDNSPSSYLVIPIISYLPFPPCYAPSINKLQPERVFKKCFQVSTMTILSLSDFSLYTGKFCDSQDTLWPTMKLKDTPRWGKHVYPFQWLKEFLPPAIQCLVPGLHTASLE